MSTDRLEALRDDLWARWRREWDRLPPKGSPPEAARVVYARGPVYDLKAYTPRAFKAGARVSAEPIAGIDNWIYTLDGRNRPLSMESRHGFNRIDWRGVYRYTADEAEYAEWCLQTGVPSQYDRIVFERGAPATFQRLVINARGSFPVWRSLFRSRLASVIASDPKNYRMLIEAYDAPAGRIEQADQHSEGLGAPPMRSRLEYTYGNGTLLRIVQLWPSGEKQTVFAARSRQSLAALADELSRRIADRTLERLAAAAFDAPLAAVELSFIGGEGYVPFIIPATTRDDLSARGLCIAIASERWLQLDREEFAPEVAEFEGRVRSGKAYAAGARMLRDAARQVTERAGGALSVAPGFVAYAIDWEAEGDDLEAILAECGASREALASFRDRGWI